MTKQRAKPHSKANKGKAGQPAKPSTNRSAQTAAQKTVPRKRTTLLAIAIVLVGLHGLIYTALSFAVIQSMGREQSPLYLSLLALASLVAIVAAVGLWLWKKWGWFLFLVAGVATAAIALLATGELMMGLGSLLQTIIVAYIVYPQLKHFE